MLNLLRKIMFRQSSVLPFNGIKTIQAHLDHRTHIENYVNGISNKRPDVSTVCQVGCLLGKTLHHDKQGVQKMNLNLVNQVCNGCEQFHEAAAQVVLHAEMGEREWAKAALREGHIFQETSDNFQKNLAALHVASWADNSAGHSPHHLSHVNE